MDLLNYYHEIMKKKVSLVDFEFWRYLINGWSMLFFTVIVYDFLSGNSCTDLLNVVSMVYIGVLAVYVSNKEFERWYHRHHHQHPGEIFVVAWSALVAVLIITDFIAQTPYHLPGSVVSSYIAVLTILAITRKSKQTYQARYQKK